MVSFATYSSLQSNDDVSLSDLAMENAEALAGDINPMCPDGCVDPIGSECLCNGTLHPWTPYKWKEEDPPEN